MKKVFQALAILLGAVIVALTILYLARPLYMNFGSTSAEQTMTLPGDEIVADPKGGHTVAATIHAAPEQIYPWLVQLGGEQGGFYSHMFVERMIRCPLVNADAIHAEWQSRQVGDPVKFCPGNFGPPAYTVLALDPNRSMILGHPQPDGSVTDTWQFVLVPVDEQTTRLLVRTRTMLTGGIWAVIDPGVVFMENGMLKGIRQRAETLAAQADASRP